MQYQTLTQANYSALVVRLISGFERHEIQTRNMLDQLDGAAVHNLRFEFADGSTLTEAQLLQRLQPTSVVMNPKPRSKNLFAPKKVCPNRMATRGLQILDNRKTR